MKATGHIRVEEPFAGLFTQGMVVHETYKGPEGPVGCRPPTSSSTRSTASAVRG